MKKVLTLVFSLYFLNIFSNNTNIDLPDSANKELYSTVEKIILKQKTQKYKKDKKNKLLKYGVLFSILCLEHFFLWKFWNYKNKNEALSGLKASALREIPLTASSEALNEGWKPYSSVDSSLLFSAETEKNRLAQPSYYKILGLSKDASKIEIKNRYRRLIVHPNLDSSMWKFVKNAYKTLSNVDLRGKYDKFYDENKLEAFHKDLSEDIMDYFKRLHMNLLESFSR